ncbi:MAG: DUF4339 domain-containing protein [Deltaproteobacteria bacterium]|nr:DUF4339 domain-containing protein [Deltaproteobacteria bacterium]
MKEWFIYQGEGNPAGPFTTELLARGILAGKVAKDAYVACQGDPQWVAVMSVAEVAAAVQAMESSGAPVQPRPINTVPPAPVPKRDTKPEEFKPLFDPGSATAPGAQPPAPPAPASAAKPLAPPAYLAGAPASGSAPAPLAPPASQGAPAPAAAPSPVAAPAAPAPAPAPAPEAAAPAPAPAPAPAAAAPAAQPAPAAEAKPAEAKKEEPKAPPLSPKYRMIPVAIFGICFVLSVVIFGVSRVVGGVEPTPQGQHSGQSK